MGLLDLFDKIKIPEKSGKEELPQKELTEKRQLAIHISPASLVKREEIHTEAIPAEARALAIERAAFLRAVQQRKVLARCTDREAVEYVAMHRAIEFPLMRNGGKGGACALNYPNYRIYKSRIKGETNPEKILPLLCDNYARGIRERRGDKRFWEIFFAFYLNTRKLPITVAYDNACLRMRKEFKDIPVPSIAQVRYQVNLIPPDRLVLAREGEEAFKNQCGDFIRREWLDILPGECLIGDSRTFDTRIRVFDEEKQAYIPVRPTITALMDARSWAIAAYWITAEPVNSDTLINTLRLYFHITEGVPPSVIYYDNGKDYCAQGFSTDFDAQGHKHSIFRELGIRLLNSLAYNARAKTVERAFRDMMQQFDKLFPDYLGSQPGQRIAAADHYDKHPEELPNLEQFCQIFASWLNKYHSLPKGGEIHRGKSPLEIWESRKNFPQRDPFTPEYLSMAFLKPEAVRTVGRGPSVKLNNTIYYNDQLSWGTKVLVKKDTLNPEHVGCFTLDGIFIGEARTRQAIHALAGDKEEIRALMRRQRGQLKEARTAIKKLAGGKEVYSPLELLLANGEEELLTAAPVRSVKGEAHNYIHHTIAGVIEGPEEKAIPEIKEEEPEYDAKMRSFHAFMTKSKKEGEDDE